MSLFLFDTFTASTDDQEPAIMPATIAPPEPLPTAQAPSETHRQAAQILRADCAAVRVSFTWLGTKKTLDRSQLDEVADTFGAEGNFVSAGKKLLDTKHPAFRQVTAIKTQATKYWKDYSLPFPEAGIRLIPRDRIDHFQAQLETVRADLTDKVLILNDHYEGMKTQARERLGRLFNPTDYPDSLVGMFAVAWDFPSVEPPDYLMQLRPDLYEAERARISAQFDQAVRLAEEAFTEEFAGLVAHLTRVLTETDENGEKKTFRDSTVNNLREFFDRFKLLNVSSNPRLDELVAEAQRAVTARGVSARTLRSDGTIRTAVAAQLSSVQTQLNGLLETAPRRRVIRPSDRPNRAADSE